MKTQGKKKRDEKNGPKASENRLEASQKQA